MNAPDSAFTGAAANDRAATAADLWVDLFAAHMARSGALNHGVPVVVTDSMRVFPLLESQTAIGWVHTSRPLYVDHLPVAQGQPARRLRIDAMRDPADAQQILRRASLCIVAVPAERSAAVAAAALVTKALQARAPVLLYGSPQAGGWPAFEGVTRQGALQPVEAGGTYVLASAGLAGALGPAGMNDLDRACVLAAQITRARQADVHAEALDDGRLRMRLRIEPVQLAAAAAETLAHHIAHEGRALFNGRGLGAMLLPWAAPCQVRLLLRNVRARIDGCGIAVGAHTLSPLAIDYTEHGAFMRLSLPATAPSHDALLHLSLPRDAVPGDGFCDIGAAEFTVETA